MTTTVVDRLSLLTAVLGLLVTVLSPPAMAADQSTYPPEVENQCRDDYFRFCSPYDLGSEALRRCMESKGRSLSHNCQQALKDAGYVKPERLRRGS